MEMTEAATTPVVAASRAPTNSTARATPPRMGPKTWPTVSSRSSAMPLRSRIRPMRVKKGMASRVSFCMMPKTRSGRAWKRLGGRRPISMPMKPQVRPTAAREKATGKPVRRKSSRDPNMSSGMWAARSAVIWSSLPDALRHGSPQRWPARYWSPRPAPRQRWRARQRGHARWPPPRRHPLGEDWARRH